MDNITTIIAALIATLPLGRILSAIEKNYARKKGIKATSPEAVVGTAKNLFIKLLVSTMLGLAIFGWFLGTSSSREMYARWSEKAIAFTNDLAAFMPKVFTAFLIIYVAYAAYTLLLILTAGSRERDIVEKAKETTAEGLRLGIIIGCLTLIATEMCCIAEGNLKAIRRLFIMDRIIAAELGLLALYITAFLYYCFAIWSVFRTVPELVAEMEKRMQARKGKHAKKR